MSARPTIEAQDIEARPIGAHDLEARAAACADRLAQKGVRAGDRVAIAAPPSEETAAAIIGAMLLGAVIVPLAPGLPREERRLLAAGARTSTLLEESDLVAGPVAAAQGGRANECMSSTMCTGTRVASSAGLPAAPGSALGALLRSAPDAPVALLHTSGTTAEPRRVLIPGRALASQASLSAARHATGPEDTWLLALPLHHIAGLAVLVRAVLDGAALEVHPRFDAERVARALAAGRVTRASLVARSLARTLDAMDALGLRPSPRLRTVLVGGGPAPEPLLERARALGLPVARTYGLTEACATVAAQVPGDADGSCGRPLDGVEVMIAAPAGEGSGTEAGAVPSLEGEILVRGPALMLGYDGAPPLARGEWLRTGDSGRIDAEGRLHVLDRRADLVVSGGENVSPARVEAALEAHPRVAEACVIGLADPIWGHRVAAVVVLREEADPSSRPRPRGEELEDHARARLAPYEVPRAWRVTTSPLPRTGSGKLCRALVRERWGSYAPPAETPTAPVSAAR